MVKVVASLIEDNGRYLFCKCPQSSKTPNLWEFPGGKVEDGENEVDALKREILEELSLHIEVGEVFYKDQSEIAEIELSIYSAKIVGGSLKLNVHQECQWVKPQDFKLYDISPADKPAVHKLTL